MSLFNLLWVIFEKTIYPAFKDEDFSNCYPARGRYAI
jgi:hypothetical protein